MTIPRWETLRWRAEAIRMRFRSRVLMFRLQDVQSDRSVCPEVRVVPDDCDPQLIPYDQQTLTGHRAKGWTLYAWFEGEVPMSFAWARVAQEHWVTEVGASARAGSEVGWIVHCVTPQPHRGRGYYPRLIREVAARLAVQTAYIYCTPSNSASRRGIEKAGFEHVGAITQTLGHHTCTATALTISS